jgi:YHS domain-containing protein
MLVLAVIVLLVNVVGCASTSDRESAGQQSAEPGQSDQSGIARQRVCPVTGAELGSMGEPVKVVVGGQPLYLCCKGCLDKVRSDPEAYLRRTSRASQVQ